jgi:hypothetical protein
MDTRQVRFRFRPFTPEIFKFDGMEAPDEMSTDAQDSSESMSFQLNSLQSSKGWIAKRSKSNISSLSIVPPEEGPPAFDLSESGRCEFAVPPALFV